MIERILLILFPDEQSIFFIRLVGSWSSRVTFGKNDWKKFKIPRNLIPLLCVFGSTDNETCLRNWSSEAKNSNLGKLMA